MMPGRLGHIPPKPNTRLIKSILADDGCSTAANPSVWRHVTAFGFKSSRIHPDTVNVKQRNCTRHAKTTDNIYPAIQ
jgi:hypothetical protein